MTRATWEKERAFLWIRACTLRRLGYPASHYLPILDAYTRLTNYAVVNS